MFNKWVSHFQYQDKVTRKFGRKDGIVVKVQDWVAEHLGSVPSSETDSLCG